jgi:D-alanyl-D-alanine carboxypeptidase/D-alanyl-D-alanine-endopeptidase (penicillin-binding protein 4)
MNRALVAFSLSVFYTTQVASLGQVNGVDELITRLNPNVNLGAVVVDLNSGDTLYQRNADRLFIPASNMKLFSEAAAIMALGPDYRFKTQLSTHATHLVAGVLKGTLYLHLSGDPSFSRQRLSDLLASLREWPIKAIEGNIIIDSTLAAVDTYPPGWLTTDLDYSYGAPIAPLILDANRLTITVNPGTEVGAPALVEVDDGGGAIALINQVTTKASEAGCGVGLSLDHDNQLTVRGCVGLGQGAVQQRIAIKNPLKYAQGIITHLLAKDQIRFNGQVILGKAPPGGLIMATEYSRPLTQLMADTLKPSDNLYADSLYLHTALALQGTPLNWDKAQAVVKNFLQQQTGIDLKTSIFTDGSGLSRYNLVTPGQTIALLTFLHQHFPMSYEYIASLPIAGRDGTLQKRFKAQGQQGFVRAKTGTMTGMNSLSGYLFTTNGHTLAFALFINRIPGSNAGPGRPVLDALCTYFLQSNPSANHLARVVSPRGRVQFQYKPTQGDVQRSHQAQWRRLESKVRYALKGQTVTILYRNHELVITDNQADSTKVWLALKGLVTTSSFAVALYAAHNAAAPVSGKPMMLWVQSSSKEPGRTWMIREAV